MNLTLLTIRARTQLLSLISSCIISTAFVACFSLPIDGQALRQTISPTIHVPLLATDFSGTDIGAKINAAFTSCSGLCSVTVPPGVYSYATTINIPIIAQGGNGLLCDSVSTRLRYTGSGDAVAAFGTGDPESGLVIQNCTLDGGSAQAGANGLHLRAFGGGTVQNLRVIGFPANGILNEGANSVTFIAPDLEFNFINLHNVGVSVNGQGWSANANKIYGGIIGYAKLWGLFEDGSEALVAFPNGGNVYDGVVFEANGTNGQLSGNAFIQLCDGCVITNSYLEFFSWNSIPENVVIGGTAGDSVGGVYMNPQGVKIVNNHFLSDNAIDGVLVLNGRMAIVESNTEVGNPTNFVNMKSNVIWSYVGHNLALAAANPVVNNDSGSGSGGVANSGTAAPTATGYSFNSLTGDSSDLSIVDRAGSGYNLLGRDASGDLIYQIYANGVAKFPGLIVDNQGLTFNTAASHILTYGGNNMVTGVVSIRSSNAGTTEFGSSYNFPPNCVVTPRQNMSSLNWWVSTTPTSVSVSTNHSTTASFTYFCAGDAN